MGPATRPRSALSTRRREGARDFSKAPQSCPDAAKLGTLGSHLAAAGRSATPRTRSRNRPRKRRPVPEPLHGSLYIAKPFANPFGSLIAVYLAIEDEKTGIVAKLAGEGELDPKTGQITTRFVENPELPLEDIKAQLFGGSRGAFITPPTCARYTTDAELTPWSAPKAKTPSTDAELRDQAPPVGGACPSTEAQMPNAPKLSAGTRQPQPPANTARCSSSSPAKTAPSAWRRIEATLPPG